MCKYLYLHIKTKKTIIILCDKQRNTEIYREIPSPAQVQEGEDDNDTNTSQNNVTHSLWCRVFTQGSSEKRGKELCHNRKRRSRGVSYGTGSNTDTFNWLSQCEMYYLMWQKVQRQEVQSWFSGWAVSPRTLLLPISQGLDGTPQDRTRWLQASQ